MINSNRQSKNIYCSRGSDGLWFRSNGIAARWQWHWRRRCRARWKTPPWRSVFRIVKTAKVAASCCECRARPARTKRPTPNGCSASINTAAETSNWSARYSDRLPPLSEDEQRLWTLDARINARGFHVDRVLAEAARELANKEQGAINNAVSMLTNGTITTANQVRRIQAFVNERGHALASLNKRSVSAVLANNPASEVRQLLELRRDGSRASVRKLNSLLAGVDADHRLRGTLRFHGAATGRWSGRRFQPQNLKKPETKEHIDAAIDAIIAGNDAQLRDARRTADADRRCLARDDLRGARTCAHRRRFLRDREPRAGLDRWRRVEARNLSPLSTPVAIPSLEPYCVTAAQRTQAPVTPDDEAGRQTGKTCDLAFGYGGGLGAWRKFDSSNTHSDADVERFKSEWRARTRSNGATSGMRSRRPCAAPSEPDNKSISGSSPSRWKTARSSDAAERPAPGLSGSAAGGGKIRGHARSAFKDNARGGWNDTAAGTAP